MRKLRLLLFAAVAAASACGCHGVPRAALQRTPVQTSQAPPSQWNVVLWDGTALSGQLALRADGTASVGDTEIRKGDIRLIQRPGEAREAGEADYSALPEGYRPLPDESISEYRRRAAEAAARHAGSDSVLCLDQGENIYHPDGRHVYRYHALTLVLKEGGRGAASISTGFQEGRSRARILFARTIAPDGSSQWAGPDEFEVSVPPQAAQFVDTRTRVLSGQAPGVAVGSFVEYAYEDEVYNPEVKDFFFPGFFFQSDKPVLDSVVDVLVPKGAPLNFATKNIPPAAGQPALSERGEFDCRRWEMHDVEPLVAEPFMPAEADLVPRVEASLYFEWKKLMSVTGSFQAERIALTPDVSQLAEEITRGRQTDDEKAAAIYHWIQKNINYLSIKASLSSGWAGHPASETLKNGYGDCTDVSILMAALCRAVGIDAYPAIIKTNDAGTMMTDIPVPDGNHAIVLLYPNGRPRFLDPTAQDYRYPYFRSDDHGVKAMIHMREEIVDVPVPPPEDNMRDSAQKIALLPDGGAQVSERNLYTGEYEAGVRGYWRSVPPELRGRMMQQYLQSRSPGALLEGFELGDMEDLDTQLAMSLDYRLPVIATRTRDLYIFTLPNFAQRFPETTLETRRFDVVIDTTQCLQTAVAVALPEGYEFAGAPEGITVHGKHLWFEGVLTLSRDGRTVTAEQVFKRLTNRVPVEDYAEYRQQAAAIAAWTDLKIVLKQTASGTAGEEAQ